MNRGMANRLDRLDLLRRLSLRVRQNIKNFLKNQTKKTVCASVGGSGGGCMILLENWLSEREEQ